MTSKINIRATSITQPLAGKRITNSSGKNIASPKVCRDGDATPAYHPWEYKTLNNFLKGNQIQCGRKSSYACDLKTVRWIKGYRNTCPIAGCCGTFNRPAPLLLSNFDFKTKKITKKIKISKIKLQYQHMCTGVDVSKASGSETKSWGGYFPRVILTLYKVTKGTSGTTETKIQTIVHEKRVPIGKKETVSAVFTKPISSLDPTNENLKVEINYAGNGDGTYLTEATNPSIIYASGLDINMEYDYVSVPRISFSQASSSSIITDARNPNKNAGTDNCRTTVSHTIRYLDTASSDIVVTMPEGFKQTSSVNTTKQTVTYTYQDTSGIKGNKNIKYTLKSNKKQSITKKIKSKLYSQPTIQIISRYIKNQTYNSDTFISITGNCWNTIKIYVDGNQKLLFSFTKTTLNQETFLSKINQLTCGNHSLYVYVDDVFNQKIDIVLGVPTISFTSDLNKEYTQSEEKASVTITRTDSNQINKAIDVTIIDTANTSEEVKTISFLPTDSYVQTLDISIPGEYTLKCQYNDGCYDKEYIIGTYTVTTPIEEHRQSYDYLLIRGIGEQMSYESIVVREGDIYNKPVVYTNAILKGDVTDFVLFAKDGLCNIGDLGYGTLAVKNISKGTLKNLAIELNPFTFSEEEYEDFNAQIAEWKTGMLKDFIENFNILNPKVKDIVEIFNIQNKDLINEGTENVVIRFSEISANDVIEIKIPYMSSYPRQIFMNFLVFGEEHDFIELDRFTSNIIGYQTYSTNHYASQNSRRLVSRKNKLCISLETQDALSTELYIEGDDLDRNDCSDESDLDITYRVRIPDTECDSATISNVAIETEIINDANLIPTGYIIDRKKTMLPNNSNSTDSINYTKTEGSNTINIFRGLEFTQKPMPSENVYLRYKDINNQIKHIRAVTNNDGVANLKFTIPNYFQDTTDENLSVKNKEKYSLTDILDMVDIFYLGDNFYKGSQLLSVTNNQLPSSQIQLLGFYYIQSNKSYYTTISQITNTNLSNVSKLYLIGALKDSNNVGLNDKIIKYKYKYQDTNTNTEKSLYTEVVTGNIPTISALKNDNTDGYFAIPIKNPNGTSTYNLSTIKQNSSVFFEGDLFYTKNNFPANANLEENDKKTTSLSYLHDYSVYRRGETIEISVILQKTEQEFSNYIKIKQNLTKTCQKEAHILYKTCLNSCENKKNNKGWKTIYRTTGNKLLENQIEKNIYCNVDTELKVLARLEKQTIENNNINILTLNAINGYKPNKEVVVKGIIAPNANKERLGDYLALTAVDIDKEKYSYDKNSDIVYWKIGDMESYEHQKCNILLQAEHIGHNIIYIGGFDYLKKDEDINVETSLELECDNTSKYYVHDQKPAIIKAKLTTDNDINSSHDIFGRVNFLKTIKDQNGNIVHDTHGDIAYKTFASSEVTYIDGEYRAQAYFRPDFAGQEIYAEYEGAKIFSVTYAESTSEKYVFDNVVKYDTNIILSSEQESYYIDEDISIRGSIFYENGSKKYFDKELNVKIFINGQEFSNIYYDDNDYTVHFIITQAGEYTIQAYIPETDKTTQSSYTLPINVEDKRG